MSLNTRLTKSWQRRSFLTLLLYPFSLLYRGGLYVHQLAYRLGVLNTYRPPLPVVIVGNLTVGGSGKTPLVIHLVEGLIAAGFKPGVVSRGYAGQANSYPLRVTVQTPVLESGDEPAMIVQRTGVAMVVGPNRRENIDHLLAREECDLIICDDGLQHWALRSDVKICIVDKTVDSDNTFLLPAGPYREAASNLARMDIVVEHVKPSELSDHKLQFYLQPDAPRPLVDEFTKVSFDSEQEMHAVAAIGKPQRFFDTCRTLGFDITEHAFPDHHFFSQADIEFHDQLKVIMTEKDAIKCQQLADQRHWYLPVNAKPNQAIVDMIRALISPKVGN